VKTCSLVLGLSLLAGASAVAAPTPAREIVIAQVAAFTGPLGPSGKGIRAGIKLYFDHVNATGGINRAQIRFISKDDGYRPADTVRLTRETIILDHPVAFIGGVGTANVEALTHEHVLTDANISVIGVASGASSMLSQPNVFITKATHHDEMDKLFSILVTTGVDRVGMVYQDDNFGIDVLAGAEKASAKTGVKLVAKAPYPRNTTDVKAALEIILKADPQLVYLAGTTTVSIEFIKQYRKRGGAAQIYGLSINDGSAIAQALGPDLAHGFAWGTVVPPATANNFAIVREYQALASKSHDPDLSGRSVEGFISAKTLVYALHHAKSLTPAAVTQAIAAISQLDLGNYVIDFNDKGHTGSRWVDFAILDSRGQIIR
jgi:ABC-type branched-subunit amino acid transport system substrate-binding protein